MGTYKKKLKDFAEKERELWRIFDRTPFEDGVALGHVDDATALRLLDHASYFALMRLPQPADPGATLAALERDALLRRCDAGGWDITNLGAVLFAARLDDFARLRRKAMRVIVYEGDSRLVTVQEQVATAGYACGFEALIERINGLLPSNEVIGRALRKTVRMFPALAVRELVANALIHQDFSVTGAGPMVEVFADRMEVTNPGAPLVETHRFLDQPPRSRNETLASHMRRMGICEERGSGVDKVVSEIERFQLPAPLFDAPGESTRAVLFAHRPLDKMDKADRVRACYLHACLRYVDHGYLTNATLRERFGIELKNKATASRIIRDAVAAGQIVPHDPDAADKLMKYIPAWASSSAPAGRQVPDGP